MLLLSISDADASILSATLVLLLCVLLYLQHRQASGARREIEAAAADEEAQVQAEQRAQRAAKRGRGAKRELTSLPALLGAIDALKELHTEYKYLEAGELLEQIREEIKLGKHGSTASAQAKQKLESLLHGEHVPQLEKRVATCKEALSALNDAQGWEMVSQKKEMRMFQRWREGNELQVKIEAVLGPSPPIKTADTLMIWREAQLYGKWFPMISAGHTLKECSHCEVIIQLIADLNFMHCDLLLHGWGVDELRDGFFLMCVRPARQSELPDVELPPHPSKTHKGKLFPATRAIALIDVLVEPLSEDSVRFAFQLSQKIPTWLPRWAVQMILHQGMANIFTAMQKTALAMATEPDSPHAKLARSPEYQPTANWLRGKFERFLKQQRS